MNRAAFPLLLIAFLTACPSRVIAADVHYSRDVRPILAKNCFLCHGADESSREADLRLDLREDALQVLSPENADDSELLHRITSDDERNVMPPPDTGKSVTPAEADILRRWIQGGADYEEHWSFRPLVTVGQPELDEPGKAWARTEIDAFIWKRLREKELTPNSEASREVLIRRLAFDLTGLPPTPEEVQAFVENPSPKAFEELVDRLLDSPRYGERWARHWLDLAQYADTHGFERDLKRPHAWRYRDYVIDSLNQDKPWTQFVQEQIAGDLLQPGSREGIIATGFVAAGPWDLVGQGLEEDSLNLRMVRNLDRDNMVHNVVQGTLGVTVQCARCHDHKFDPVRASDYYSMQAVFADVERGDVPLPGAETVSLQKKFEALRESITARSPELAQQRSQLNDLRETLSAAPDVATAFENLSRRKQETLALQASFPKGTRTWDMRLDLGTSRAIRSLFVYPMQVVNAKGRVPGQAFPSHFRLEVSDDADFSENVTVVAYHMETPATNPLSDFFRADVNTGVSARYVRMLVPFREKAQFAMAEVIALDDEGWPIAPVSVTANFGEPNLGRLTDGWLSTHPFSYDEIRSSFALVPQDPSKSASLTLDLSDAEWLDTVHVATDSPQAKVQLFAGDSTTPLRELSGWWNPWRDASGRTFNARSLRPSALRITIQQGTVLNVVAIARGRQILSAETKVRTSENLDASAIAAWLAQPRPSGYPLRWATDLSATHARLVADIDRMEKDFESALKDAASPAECLQLNEWLAEMRKADAKRELAYALKPLRMARPVSLLTRGNETSPAQLVTPRAPDLMTHHPGTLEPDLPPRLAFARWVTAPENDLFWRNIVNRVWMLHFGNGLSNTPDDLGMIGSYPSHPELLDWLAARFRQDGSLKNLHRLILNSAVWRQSSEANEDAAAIDGQNRYLARMNRSRLDAEAVHDAHLWLAGTLNLESGGPGFRRFEETGTYQPTYHYDQYDPADPRTHRRSIYRHVVRGTIDPMMESFDCADPNLNVAQRVETLTATQALTLVNHTFTNEMARRFADRVAGEAHTPTAQVERVWQLIAGRSPDAAERKVLLTALHGKSLEFACRLALNSNAFLYLD
jgi:hypothetical protein